MVELKKLVKIALAIAVIAAISAAAIIKMGVSSTGPGDNNTAMLSLSSSSDSGIVAYAATPDPTVSPARTPLAGDRNWYTVDEILGAFGPEPASLAQNATETFPVKCGDRAYPYPNGTMAYYTDHMGAARPTTDQVIAFLATDDTYRQHTLTEGKFVCVNFAVMLHDSAEARGIEAHMASVFFSSGPSSGSGHMVNAFNTTDAGWVYVDATENGWILIGPLREGDKYRGTLMECRDGKWGFFRTETGNIVSTVEII
ncbi:hypothetical protein MCP_2790 [Methanocella paludicola SANAE]|uniref:Transglutaminase-like domain-containing protein n=2 Tax=Methanocella TaxID=570266 RepID=D1Z2E0_METPS|nr:hypothetical protein MCP_2790 [Methanocella paludicola SANAE]